MAFSYYSPVTINTGQVPSTQTDFPVLISLTDARFKTVANGGHVNNSGGFDIRPYSDSGITTPITGYELVLYNGSTGTIEMHVKRSSVSDGLVTYLAYGNAALNTDATSTTTWSNSFVRVHHLKDGTTLSITDSTGLGTPTNHGATATTGQIDGGTNVASASSQYIDCATIGGAINSSLELTVSGWAKPTSFPNAYNAAFGYNGTSIAGYALIMPKSTGKVAWYIQATAPVSVDPGSATLVAGTWYYLALTYDTTNGLKSFVNTTSDGTAAANGSPQTNSGSSFFYIGQDPLTAGRFFNGAADEVRLSSVARSTNWLVTEYNNQNSPSTFETLGTEVSFNPIVGLYTK